MEVKPIPALISTGSIITMELLQNVDTVFTRLIQLTIGILTIIYLIRKIKQQKP